MASSPILDPEFAPFSVVREPLMIVDDEEPLRRAVQHYFTTKGYDIAAAGSAAEALDLLGQRRFALAIVDVRMPGMSGVDFVAKAREQDHELAMVMLSGVNDAPTATASLSHGACDYLVKPVELARLMAAVEKALHTRMLVIHQNRFARELREEVQLRTSELEQEKRALARLSVSIAETLVNAMEAKSVYLRGGSQRIAELAASIADHMGLDADVVEDVRLAGRLHDIGKIGTREDLLNRPGTLTAEEFAHLGEHVRIGLEILAPLSHLGAVLTYVAHHHEHWDGSGYPAGLSGQNISIGGRILAAADAFDALTSERPYRQALAPRETLEHLRSYSGTLLDPDVYAALRSVVGRRRTLTLAFVE